MRLSELVAWAGWLSAFTTLWLLLLRVIVIDGLSVFSLTTFFFVGLLSGFLSYSSGLASSKKQ